MVPDSPAGFNFKPACDAHDAAYSTLGVTKEEADLAYLDDLLKICMDSYQRLFRVPYLGIAAIEYHSLCVKLAYGYFIGVREFGETAYKEAQEIARSDK